MYVHLLDAQPDLLAIHAADRRHFPCLLMSAGRSGWDILFALPRALRIYADGEAGRCRRDLADLPCRTEVANPHGLPFTGGWLAFLGYEMLQAFEARVPVGLPDEFPLAALARVPAALLIDRATGRAWAVAEDVDAWDELMARRAAAEAPLAAAAPRVLALSEDEPQRYIDAVHRLKRYIREGDVFQVNISRGWQAELDPATTAVDLFAALRRTNPAPFSALADFGSAQIVSSSPERLVEVRGDLVRARPIAGTHPRSADPSADAALKSRLIASVKERAEHVMLIDLARNDLGRICRPGSVEVSELMAVASYAYVHHIESEIRGRLRPDVHPAEVLAALFPGGTITGCPKVRTMQIIRELEGSARRAYTGSLGYINRDGSLDFNILIRTFMRQGARLRFRAGGGIVADSDPARELMETRHKARGLLRALGEGEA